MSSPLQPTHRCFLAGLGLFLALATATFAAEPERIRLESAGARFGLHADFSKLDFFQSDLIVKWALPFGWDLGREWHVRPRLETSAGWLGDNTHDAAIGSFGSAFVFSRGTFPLSLEAGLNLTLISHWEFEERDLATPLQFTTHIGLNADLSRRYRLTYRYQHMSNNGFSKPNPGLNLHLFGLCYVF